ncbi:MAG: metallophosphoesterase [Flavobacteriales bacterium]
MNIYYTILFLTPVLIIYSYRAVHIVTENMTPRLKWTVRITYLLLTILVYISTTYLAVNREDYEGNEAIRSYTIIGAITLSVTILSISVVQLIADLILGVRMATNSLSSSSNPGEPISRWTFLSKVALGAGGVMLGSFLYGTTKGVYGWRILRNQLSFKNLPQSFDGARIVQISDLHLGSFRENFAPLEEAVQMINELSPDYIVFTGDLVNEDPQEAAPWINVFTKLKAKSGKYAILGNHDYRWGKSDPDKEAVNRLAVRDILEQMELTPLLNEHRVLEKNGEKIGLVGVENWGYSPQGWFPTYGDYKKSVAGMEEVPFKILLSHDPTHWEHHIKGKEAVDLTLSGHTHGGQMGITIPGLFEFSVAKFLYKRYAGLYTEGDQQLYINRGMGFLIFPGRVGMPPEITLHELKKA